MHNVFLGSIGSEISILESRNSAVQSDLPPVKIFGEPETKISENALENSSNQTLVKATFDFPSSLTHNFQSNP